MSDRLPDATEQDQTLYRHVMRPRWGLAIMAFDHHDKRGYQFEDGKLRIIKRGYYKLLEEVQAPADRTMRVLERLGRALGRRQAARRANEELIPLAIQIAHFRNLHPAGFEGEAWVKKVRGRGEKKVLKRHRDPAVARARERLSAKALGRLIKADDHEAVLGALIEVLDETNLVSAAKLKPLRRLAAHRRSAAAEALRELLYGEGAFAGRLEAWIQSLGEASWELATAPTALVHPDRHVCVRPSVFKQQAQWMAPRLEHSSKPDAMVYMRYLKMAQAVQAALTEAGLPPADLLDVLDFIYDTLRPAVRKVLVRRAKAIPSPAPTRAAVEPTASEVEAA